MSKRGILTMEELVKLVPTVLLVVFFIWALVMLFKPADPSVTNMKAMADSVSILMSKTDSFAYNQILIPFGQKSVLRGFGSADEPKPDDCNGKPCLCIYDDIDKATVINSASDCQEIKNVRTPIDFLQPAADPTTGFDAPYPDQIPKIKYSELFMTFKEYSYSGDNVAISVYLEKYDAGGKTYLFIAKISPGTGWNLDAVDLRVSAMTPCPPNSSTECQNSLRGARVSEGFCQFDDETSKCVLKKADNCPDSNKVSKECVCGLKIAKPGFYCIQLPDGGYDVTELECAKIIGCDKYCAVDGEVGCGITEKSYCEFNTCSLEGGCKVEVEIDRELGKTWTVCNEK